MPTKKQSKSSLGSLLIADRFSGTAVQKKLIQRNSVTEYSGLSRLSERLSVLSKNVCSRRDPLLSEALESKYCTLLDGLCYEMSIPPRVPHSSVEAGEYKTVESIAFSRWKSLRSEPVFERNIEVWRQFWIACERADTIAQIVDARHPEMFLNTDIHKLYPSKRHIIFCNKSDLISTTGRIMNASVPTIMYSAKNALFEYSLSGSTCLVGYPNVGKSSTINMILRKKKVRVSSTPGKTRSIQTIETPMFTLIDCPGLVFPRHNKLDLVLMGVLNVDHIQELLRYADEIVRHFGSETIRRAYKLHGSGDVLEDMGNEKGWTKAKCLKIILKDYAMGDVK